MLKKPILISSIWSYTNIIFTGIFLTSVVLIFSRFVNVRDYGLFVSATLIIDFLSLIANLGISAFLIKREKIDMRVISISFYVISLISLFLIFGINLSSFLNFDSKNFLELSITLRILSVNILSKNLLSILNSIWYRELNNKLITKISIISGILSFVLAIILVFVIDPFKALLIYTVAQPIIQLLISLRFAKLNLSFIFDFSIAKEIFFYGIPIVFSRLISHANNQAPKIACVIFFGNFELGILSAAILITESIHKIFITSMWSIWMPLLAKIKREVPKRFGEVYIRLRNIQAAVIIPIFITLLNMRKPILEYLLPEKFYEIEKLLPFLVFASVFVSLNYLFRPTLILIGKTKERVILDIFRLFLCFIFLIPFSKLGFIKMTFSLVLIELIFFLISQYLLQDILKKSLLKQIYPLKGIFISLTILSFLYIFSNKIINYNFNIISTLFCFSLTLILYILLIFKIDKTLFLEFKDLKNTLFKNNKIVDI